MSGVKRTRPDDISTMQSETTTNKIAARTEISTSIENSIEEEYNWYEKSEIYSLYIYIYEHDILVQSALN